MGALGDRLESQIMQIRYLASSSPDACARLSAALALLIADAASDSESSTSTADTVRGIIKARNWRASMLGDGLFADHAWDMLLELYAAADEGRPLTASSLCKASGAPVTTGLRYVAHLESRRLIQRVPGHRDDGVFLEPTPTSIHLVEAVTSGFAPRLRLPEPAGTS